VVYDANIPIGTDWLSVSQPQILENFSQLNTVFDLNHVPFDDGSAVDRGKHTYVTMLENAGGSPLTAAGEGAIYVDNPGGTREYAYYKRENAGAGTGIEIPFSHLAGYGKIIGAGFGGTPFNLASVTNPSTGTYNVTLTNPMVDANYAVVAIAQADVGFKFIPVILSQTAAGFTVQIFDDGGNFVQPTSVNVILFGEIA